MKKNIWILPAAVVLVILVVAVGAALLRGSSPRTQLLPNDTAEVDSGGTEWTIPEEEIPLTGTPPAGSGQQSPEATRNAYAAEVLRLVNEARAGSGLTPLRLDEGLRTAAQVRAQECVGTFSHTRPNGTSYKTAVAEAGVISNYLGENAASGQTTPLEAVQDWLDSPGHRANILNPSYTQLGIGLAENKGNGFGGYAWVQIFSNG